LSAPDVTFTPEALARWADGEVVRGDRAARVSGVSIDTRTLAAGEAFFAIRGPHHDGHDHLLAACEAGAVALVTEPDRVPPGALPAGLAVVAVADTTRAFGDAARGHRRNFRGSLIGLTGSSGKTTTKEMCKSVLSVQAPCLATRGNLNNEYGVPLTLFERESQHALAVIELGMNHRGEIARLAEIAEPQVGLVTNIGTAHIEFLGSQEEIANEKGDLFAALPAGGVACVNRDDQRVTQQAARARCAHLGYGRSDGAEVRASEVTFAAGRFTFWIEAPESRSEVRVRGLSETTVINALAAAAVGLAAGLSPGQVSQGLASYQPIAGRMTPVPLESGVTLIDDSYNANPDSMARALESLRSLAGPERAIAVVGDMGELGAQAEVAHREAGARAARLGIDALFAVGDRAALVCEGAVAGGLPHSAVAAVESHHDAAERVRALAGRGDWVLIKGSRAMQMERVVAALSGSETH